MAGNRRLERRPWIPVLGPVVVFWDAMIGRRLLAPNDGSQFLMPLYRMAGAQWRAGHLPGWDWATFSGFPLLASAQAAVFYPPIVLFVLLPSTVAMNSFVVLHFAVAGTGAWFLARKLCDDQLGALVAGAAFGWSGFMFGHLGHTGLLASMSWLPWTFWAFECLRARFSVPRLAGSAAFITLAVFAGHLQSVFMTAMFLALYAIGLALAERDGPKWRTPLLCLVVLSIGFGLASVQLVPTLRFLSETRRASFSYQDAMSYSLPPSHAPLFFFPYLFGTSIPTGPFAAYTGRWDLYVFGLVGGGAALVFAAAGLKAVRQNRRMAVLAGVAALTSLLALGPATPLSRLLYRVPVYGQFRAWARYSVMIQLLVALLAAHGVRFLRSEAGAERSAALRRAVIGAGMVPLSAVLLPRISAVHRYLPRGQLVVAAVTLPIVAAGAAAAVASLLARRRRGQMAVVVVVALDLILSFGQFSEWRTGSPSTAEARRVVSQPPVWGAGPREQGGVARFLFLGTDITPLKSGTVTFDYPYASGSKGLWSANGQNPLSPAAYLETLGMSPFGLIAEPERLWRPGSWLLDLLRVTTVIVDRRSVPSMPEPGGRLNDGTAVPGRSIVRYDYSPRLPDAFVVGASVERPRSAVLRLLDGSDRFDPTGLALLEQPCPKCPTGLAGPAGEARVVRRGPASSEVEATSDQPGMLVVSQAWLPGWSAEVDGHTAPVVRVDAVVQGVPVTAGRHRVVLRYRPPGVGLGLAVTAAMACALLVAAALERAHGTVSGAGFVRSRT